MRCTCIAKVSVETLNRAPRKARNGTKSLYRSAVEWSFLSTTNICDLSANIHVAYSTSLVTRGSSLSHSREQHFTYWSLFLSSSTSIFVPGGTIRSASSACVSISSHSWKRERLHDGCSKRSFISPSWSTCSGASGIGNEEQAVELPVLALLALPSAVVLRSTARVWPVMGWTSSFNSASCLYTFCPQILAVTKSSPPIHSPKKKS